MDPSGSICDRVVRQLAPLYACNPKHGMLNGATVRYMCQMLTLVHRLPWLLASMACLSCNLSLAAASVLSPSIAQRATELAVEAKGASCEYGSLVSPRYPSLPAGSLTALPHLMARTMSTLPTAALEPPLSASKRKQVTIPESDSEDLIYRSASVSNPVPLLRRTLK